MGIAFEMVRVALGLAHRGDLVNEIIAKRIIELAKAGERNPDLLCERALKEIRGSRVNDTAICRIMTLDATYTGATLGHKIL